MSLQDAKAECTKVNSGASLAIIDDVEENTFLTQMATDLVSYTGADYYESYFLGKRCLNIVAISFSSMD